MQADKQRAQLNGAKIPQCCALSFLLTFGTPHVAASGQHPTDAHIRPHSLNHPCASPAAPPAAFPRRASHGFVCGTQASDCKERLEGLVCIPRMYVGGVQLVGACLLEVDSLGRVRRRRSRVRTRERLERVVPARLQIHRRFS